ncbi:MAG TPA: hypothetical protein VFG29_05215 [Syntrophales bacterium]|nr:hypothetical protein [Syntrophales bacterium]
MPFIQKRRIWWEPVTGATSYVVYVGTEAHPINPETFSWGDTPEVISKTIPRDTTEIVIPDEWPEFPRKRGIYHIAVTARDDDGNQSDPLFLSAAINLTAPPPPCEGGIEFLSRNVTEQENLEDILEALIEAPAPPVSSQTGTMIRRGMEQVKNNEELVNAYLGSKFASGEKEIL